MRVCACGMPRSSSKSSGDSRRPACRHSAKRVSSAVTRARPSSGSPIRTARSGRSTSFTKTSTTMARRRRLAPKKCRSRRNRPCPIRAWEHHLRDTIPARIPHDDNTLQEVRLEGSFNRRTRDRESRRVVGGGAEDTAARGRDLSPRSGRRSCLHRAHRAARAGGRRSACAGGQRRRRRACARRVCRHQDRKALGNRLLRRRGGSDARASNHRAQAWLPAQSPIAPGRLSGPHAPGRGRLRHGVTPRRADGDEHS